MPPRLPLLSFSRHWATRTMGRNSTQLKIALGLATLAWAALGASPLRVEVSWEKPLDGRVILILAHRSPPEPRAQVSELLSTAQIFGVDVEGARSAAIDGSTLEIGRAHV